MGERSIQCIVVLCLTLQLPAITSHRHVALLSATACVRYMPGIFDSHPSESLVLYPILVAVVTVPGKLARIAIKRFGISPCFSSLPERTVTPTGIIKRHTVG